MSLIEMRGLRKDFTVRVRAGRLRRTKRTVSAVDGIDLAIAVGEMVGYIGSNGAGKSTTLKMLTGVLTPSAGHVEMCGLQPVPQRTKLALRLGVVFGQRSQLWWDLPLRESFALLRHIYRVPAADHAARLRRCVVNDQYRLAQGAVRGRRRRGGRPASPGRRGVTARSTGGE
jgi:ABC-2 type transport system ATP-binding protein